MGDLLRSRSAPPATALAPHRHPRLTHSSSLSPPLQNKTKPSRGKRLLAALTSRKALSLWLLWGAWLALAFYASSTVKSETPFDPWDILQLQRGATAADARRAYRRLSLIYHPDKNPDPAASKFFAESITKAYKALTGEWRRWEGDGGMWRI